MAGKDEILDVAELLGRFTGKPGRPRRGWITERENKDGTITFTLGWHETVDGNLRRRQRKILTAKPEHLEIGRRLAEEVARKTRREWYAGDLEDAIAKDAGRVDVAFEEWLADIEGTVAPATESSYRNATDLALESGALPELLGDVTRDHLRGFQKWRSQKAAPRTVNKDVAILRIFWNWLRDRGRVESYPFKGLRPMKEISGRKRILSAEEIVTIREHLEAERPYYAAIFDFALLTGIRPGELADLEDDDVGEDTVLVVNRKAQRGNAKAVQPVRPIPLGARAREAAARIRELRPEAARGSERLFLRSPGDGRRYKSGQHFGKVGAVVGNWMKKAGVAASIKACRHTFCTMALAHTGGDLVRVMAWMGHTRIETTRGYLHYVKADHAQMEDFNL